MQVLLLGASGLVGRECLALLVADSRVARITVLLRRPMTLAQLVRQPVPPALAERVELHVVDFERLAHVASEHPQWFKADAVISTMGTTMKQAGSQAAFRKVDADYPLAVARLARQHGARHFLLVSAMGASATSGVFYNRVKGEVEQALAAMGFDRLTIARPSLLLGQREQFRPAERMATWLAFLIPPPWTPVHVRQVARGLHEALHEGSPGQRMLANMVLRCHPASPIGIPTH